jgi:hypothetical protein
VKVNRVVWAVDDFGDAKVDGNAAEREGFRRLVGLFAMSVLF